MWIVLSETINNFAKFAKKHNFFRDAGPQDYGDLCHIFMYIAPSNDRSLLTLALPFKVIQRRFGVVFWCLEWECCTFQTSVENRFKFTKTMALKVLGKSVGLCITTKKKDQLYISLLVSVRRIICENFNPNGLILAEIWMKII